MNNFQRVARNTIFLIGSEIFIKALSLIWVVFIAHSMTITDYGKYNIINSFISIFSLLPDFGIGLIIIREITRARLKVSYILGNGLIAHSLLALITCAIVIVLLPFLQYSFDTKVLIVLACVTLVFSALRSVGIYYFDANEHMHISALLNSLNTVFLLLGGLIGFILTQTLFGLFLGMLCGTLVSFCTSWGSVLRHAVIPRFSMDTPFMKKLFISGAPLGIANFLFLVYSRVDSIMLGHFLGERPVGVYNAAMPFVFSAIQLLNVPFVIAVFPALARVYEQKDSKRFEEAVKKSFLFVLFWSLPFALGISYCSPFVIPLIFGHKYSEAIPILQILIFSVPFMSLIALLYRVLIVMNRQTYYLWGSIIGTILSIGINYFLIPRYGILGSVYSSLITQGILFVLYCIAVIYFLYDDRKKEQSTL